MNYALTLEHLEDKFYREGLANYTEADFANAGFDATFYANLKEISYDETTHVSFLTSALKDAAVAEVCQYIYTLQQDRSNITSVHLLLPQHRRSFVYRSRQCS